MDVFRRVFPGFLEAWEAYLPPGVHWVRCTHCERLLLDAWRACLKRGPGSTMPFGVPQFEALQLPYCSIIEGGMVALDPTTRTFSFTVHPAAFEMV